ncbi:unnamed protein product [Urochloa decumbens]|uniref:Uncharacterized protein n=1 Tax=Urochloa decumbens TaxID=240449 RepID=A0ABC9DDW2_9POAL
MNYFGKIGATIYNLDTVRLPPSSYLNLGGGYAKLLPFIVAGEGGSAEHKMLNWTNSFLLSKLGHIDDDSHDVINQINGEGDINKIKQLIMKLPDEIKEHLEGYETEEQVRILNNMRRSMDKRITSLERDIRDLREDMRDVMQGIREIKDKLDRMNRSQGQNPYNQ